MSLETRAQQLNPNDTICPTVRIYQNLLIGAKQSVALKGELKEWKERVSTLQGVIKDFQGKDSATIVKYDEQITELNIQISINEKLLKKEKRKRFWTSVGGGAATVGAFWLGMQMGK